MAFLPFLVWLSYFFMCHSVTGCLIFRGNTFERVLLSSWQHLVLISQTSPVSVGCLHLTFSCACLTFIGIVRYFIYRSFYFSKKKPYTSDSMNTSLNFIFKLDCDDGFALVQFLHCVHYCSARNVIFNMINDMIKLMHDTIRFTHCTIGLIHERK